MIKAILIGMAVREGLLQAVELRERHQIFNQARADADSLGQPLLVVGAPKWNFSHPAGDVTIDINPRMGESEVEVADVRDIPYPTGYFGAAFCSHVLEHLPTIEDACRALDEMERVADRVFVVSPHKTSIMAQIHPEHRLWVTPSGDGYIIEQRGNRTSRRQESYVVATQAI
jgi:hypothetical protein